MEDQATRLLAFYFGGGFIIFLFWAGMVGQVLHHGLAHRRAWVTGLAIAGVVHPAAAVTAWDIARLTRSEGRAQADVTQPAPSTDRPSTIRSGLSPTDRLAGSGVLLSFALAATVLVQVGAT